MQKKELAAALLKDNPERSNRAIGEIVKLDDKTVGSVRREMEGRAEIPHVEKTVDTKGRHQPTRKIKTGQTKADRVARERVDGFVGVAGGLLLSLDVDKPRTFSMIVQEMVDRQEVREEVEALRDWLNRLLDMCRLEREQAKKVNVALPETKPATTGDDGLDIPAYLRREEANA